MSRREHMIVTCNKCKGWYDMDFEEAWDDLHQGRGLDMCLAQDGDWSVDVVACDDWDNCDCAPPSKGLRADFPDLSALPLDRK